MFLKEEYRGNVQVLMDTLEKMSKNIFLIFPFQNILIILFKKNLKKGGGLGVDQPPPPGPPTPVYGQVHNF